MTIPPPNDWTDDARRPPVVIAIPNWNRGELLRDCVDGLLELTAYPRYRVCIFDQGSTDSSREHIHGWGERVDAILAPENVGYIPANNAVIDRYPAWDVVLLNNDTRIVDPSWLDTLVATAYSAGDIGLVGAKLVYPDGRLQEAGSQIFQNGSARAYGKYEDPAAPAFNLRRDVDFCSAACLYVKRAVLRACGGFEPCFIPCYYEDVDLALKARVAGFRTVYEPAATIVHKEYGTSGKTSATDLMIRNRGILLGRWQELLNGQPLSLWQMSPGDARDRVLLVGDAVDGSSRADRSKQLLEALADTYTVAYAHTDPATTAERLRMPAESIVAEFYPGSARAVGSPDLDLAAIVAHNRFRWIVFDSPGAAAAHIATTRAAGAGARIAIDAAAERDPIDCSILGAADVVLAGTGPQRDRLRRQCPNASVAIVPSSAGKSADGGLLEGAIGRVRAFIRGTSAEPLSAVLARFEHPAPSGPAVLNARSL